jgi:hypothetical protein
MTMAIRDRIEKIVSGGASHPEGVTRVVFTKGGIQIATDLILSELKKEIAKCRISFGDLPAFTKLDPKKIPDLLILISNAKIDSLIEDLE